MILRKAWQLFAAASLLAVAAGCAGPTTEMAAQPAKQPIYVYAYTEGGKKKPQKGEAVFTHTLFIMGDGTAGNARYSAAAFENGARASLTTSGDGTYSIAGTAITVKAGGLDAKGTIKPNEYIELGGNKYTFAMKM